MKSLKVVGLFFIILGLILFIAGIIKCITTFSKTDERIYTTATIVNIEEYETNDDDQPIGYKTFVEFEINSEKRISELNTYRSDFKPGKKVEVYYFADDTEMVYEKESDILLTVFPIVGILVIVMGALLAFHKKLQLFLLRLPSSE